MNQGKKKAFQQGPKRNKTNHTKKEKKGKLVGDEKMKKAGRIIDDSAAFWQNGKRRRQRQVMYFCATFMLPQRLWESYKKRRRRTMVENRKNTDKIAIQ